jgi:hypothetical protein
LEWTDVSEVPTASIVALKMEAVRTSETSVCSNETAQNTFISILDVVRTCNSIRAVHFFTDTVELMK